MTLNMVNAVVGARRAAGVWCFTAELFHITTISGVHRGWPQQEKPSSERRKTLADTRLGRLVGQNRKVTTTQIVSANLNNKKVLFF